MRNKLGSLKVSDTKIISNFRRLTSQCCATGALGLLLLITGGNFGLPTILIPALYNSTEMNVTMTDVSWIGSINCISIPIGSAPSGIYIDYFGRRLGVIIMTIPMFLGWLILHFADDIFDVLVALTLIGIACGIVEGPIFMYIAEISETRFRSALLSTANTAAIVGSFFIVLVGSLVYWRILVLTYAARQSSKKPKMPCLGSEGGQHIRTLWKNSVCWAKLFKVLQILKLILNCVVFF
ncbi:sugar transporter ERD6-like 4 isoform X4 [Nasonia vitripennis]|uniref:Major facilitator superfamily (MFS) profile domain-containing protein n=1 Tax=Nasonia vitripennis TaxID=7425 RepID=A0A7M7QZ16_NASVI|nr:sugar transporter ERD6-like 4 isoform X4 [Nasonia vitripennis]